jgi:hypothetical protein
LSAQESEFGYRRGRREESGGVDVGIDDEGQPAHHYPKAEQQTSESRDSAGKL